MSNSNHDPKNKECAIFGEEHEKEIECEHPCTCRPEQKEDWEEEFDKEFVKYATGSGEHFNWGTKPPHIKDFLRTQIALAEERGRREGYANGKAMRGKEWKEDVAEIRLSTITEFVDWAKKYRIFTSTCGHTGDEEKGYQKGLTAGESLFQSELLAFADSLKSNLTQKS